MRIDPIPEADVPPEQQSLYEAFVHSVRKNYPMFKTMDGNGALLGPWAVWLRAPRVGEAIRQLILQIESLPGLDKRTIQSVILSVGSHFRAAYELYAHIAMAEAVGLDAAQIAALKVGDMPADLGIEATTAVQAVKTLLAGGPLPADAYAEYVRVLGQQGFEHLVYIVGQYCLVSVCLNAYDIPGDYEDGQT